MFKDMMNKIFRHATPAAERPHDALNPGSAPSPTVGSGGVATATRVDVETILTKLASANKEKLDWRHSIVDLMKLIDMDSSLAARKDLAEDLNYKGDTTNSASMNTWLHGEVMRKLAANGGNVPADLLAR
jgi:hypothetical protein